ncbi:MAG: hypothetical protein KAV82_09395 [Phycisphaerae bacterium]|nr:hypothetical protein [Phycisphaerae bacterium]
MRKKQARQPAAAESQQLTLFSLFGAQSSENPLTQALSAGGQQHSHNRLRGLPKPSSSGPAFSENPTTTALYGSIRNRQSAIPNRMTRRDERQVELQQFSTPPAQAFVVVKAAGLRYGWYAG